MSARVTTRATHSGMRGWLKTMVTSVNGMPKRSFGAMRTPERATTTVLRRHRRKIARDVAGAVADADDADALADEGLRLLVVMRMQIFAREGPQPFDVKRLAQMAARDDDRVEDAAIRLVGLDLPSAPPARRSPRQAARSSRASRSG